MDKELFLENQAKKFGKILKLKIPVEVKKDRTFANMAEIDLYRYLDNDELFYLIKYDAESLNKLTKANIIHTILHELYHIKFGHINISERKMTIKKRTKCEYQAEKATLLYIKNNLPKYYKRTIRHTKNCMKCDNKIYREAFKKVLEEIK